MAFTAGPGVETPRYFRTVPSDLSSEINDSEEIRNQIAGHLAKLQNALQGARACPGRGRATEPGLRIVVLEGAVSLSIFCGLSAPYLAELFA
jgi:hypothetical protein